MNNEAEDVNTAEATADQTASTGEETSHEVSQDSPASVSEQIAQVAGLQAALQKAEDAIVREKQRNARLQKALGDDYVEEPQDDLRSEIRSLHEKIDSLVVAKPQEDETLKALAKAKNTIGELAKSLVAKQTVSNSGVGTNQSKLGREPSLPELNAMEQALAQRKAQRERIPLEQAEKSLREAKAKASGELGVAV